VKKFFNWILVLGACVGLIYCIGLIVPRSQTQGSKTTLTSGPEQLFALVSDPSTWADWNPEVASIQERPERDKHKVWFVTDQAGRTYEMEVTLSDAPMPFVQANYTVGGTRFVLRFDFNWHGQGSRARVTKTSDTRDVWQRARRFFLPTKEASAITLLNALAEHFGEAGSAEGT
jgi:hypothetical protein